MYRQGDLWIIPIDNIPDAAERIECTHRVILAMGEATGHHHTIALAEADVQLYSIADEVDRYLRVRSRIAPLRHEEHGPIEIPAGDYRIIRQVEYQAGEIRSVAD